jgi:hypothetical protein
VPQRKFFLSEQRFNFLALGFIKFSLEKTMLARDAQATDQGPHGLVILSCHDCPFRPMGPVSEGSRFNKKPQRNLGTAGFVGTETQQNN